MANESVPVAEKVGVRPPLGDLSRPVLQDEPDNIRQRFLDEVIGRPPVVPKERLQVIRQEETKQAPAKKQTPSEIAQAFGNRAHDLLSKAHKSLQFTNDEFEPQVVPFQAKHRLQADATPADIARARLGKSATKDQIDTYVDCLIHVNDLKNADADTVLKQDTSLKLPGQRSNGAIFYRDRGASVSEWSDGSMERLTERGRGYVSLRESDGTAVEISWNPERSADTVEIRTKDNDRVELNADGSRHEKVWNDKDSKWVTSRVSTTDGSGRAIVAEFKNGKSNPENITITDKDKNVFKLTWDGKSGYSGEKLNAKGEVLEKRVHATASRSGLNIFWENDGKDNGTVRTYEDGTEEDYNKDDYLIERRGKDAWNRKVTEKYDDGDPLPYEVVVSLNDKEKLSFQRHPFGFYSAPYKDAEGKKIGTIDLRRNGLLVFNNDIDQTSEAHLPDGTKIVRKHMPDAQQEVTETKDGNVLRRSIDRQGTVIDAEYTSNDGRKIYRKLSSDGQSIDKVTITDASKAQTELNYDRNLGLFAGVRKDEKGTVLEKCFYHQGKIFYTDVDPKTGGSRFEKLNFLEKDLFGLKVSPGTYDALTGTVTSTAPDGTKTVESFSPGRTDVIREGTVAGTTITGERSTVLPSGETVVHNPDNSGVRLTREGSIDRWGLDDKQNGQDEPLTKVEGEFLRSHADTDKRDLLAIHVQFRNKPEVIDNFYKELAKLDDAKNLTDAERNALRKGIMHHVAFPAEIYQGNTWCCNVAVIERDMAMNMPDKYAKTLVQALSDGKVSMPDGSTLPTDKCNLRVLDSTGRNFVSRVFQTVAIQAKYYPRYTFTNTEDGVGRLLPGDEKARPAAFVGLNMDDICSVRYKMTGEKKAVVAIQNLDDLYDAWKNNDARSMVVAVNADEPPFSEGGLGAMFAGQTESSPNHVVSITRLEDGPPPLAYVQNQWGLSNDLSTPDTAVPAEVLLNSMLGRVRDPRGRIVPTPAQALTTGDPTKTYLYANGKLIEEKRRR